MSNGVLKSPVYWAAIICTLLLVWPFRTVIGLAIITTVICLPLYQTLLQKLRSASLSVLVIWLLISGITIGVGWTTKNIIQSQQSVLVENKTAILRRAEALDKYLPSGQTPFFPAVGASDLPEAKLTARSLLSQAEQYVRTTIRQQLPKVPSIVIGAFLFFFLVTSLMLRHADAKTFALRLMPFDKTTNARMLRQSALMVRSIFSGGLLIAGLQALATALACALVGIPFFGAILVASFILYFFMIGTVVIYVPAAIYLATEGKLVVAIGFVIANVIIANLDVFLRGALLDKSVRLDSTLIFVSILSGAALVGAIGVFVGPVLAVIGLEAAKSLKAMQK